MRLRRIHPRAAQEGIFIRFELIPRGELADHRVRDRRPEVDQVHSPPDGVPIQGRFPGHIGSSFGGAAGYYVLGERLGEPGRQILAGRTALTQQRLEKPRQWDLLDRVENNSAVRQELGESRRRVAGIQGPRGRKLLRTSRGESGNVVREPTLYSLQSGLDVRRCIAARGIAEEALQEAP